MHVQIDLLIWKERIGATPEVGGPGKGSYTKLNEEAGRETETGDGDQRPGEVDFRAWHNSPEAEKKLRGSCIPPHWRGGMGGGNKDRR